MSNLITPFGGYADGPFQTVIGEINNTLQLAIASNSTIVAKYNPAVFQSGGSSIKLTIQGPPTSGRSCVHSAIYIGHAAASGSAYDFDGGQVAVTFASSGSVTVPANEIRTSDVIPFVIDPSKFLLIAYNATGGALNLISRQINLGVNYSYYIKAGVSQAATTVKDASGYLVAPASPYLKLLDAASL